jgi:hypothetical protein
LRGLRIEGAIDMHCHFGPDSIGTPDAHPMHTVTGLEAAREALESGHRAIVLKSHSFASVQLAAEIEQMVPGLRVFAAFVRTIRLVASMLMRCFPHCKWGHGLSGCRRFTVIRIT